MVLQGFTGTAGDGFKFVVPAAAVKHAPFWQERVASIGDVRHQALGSDLIVCPSLVGYFEVSGAACLMQVVVKTSDLKGAGTDANVFLTLFGEQDGKTLNSGPR
jgi:hypothetical protein